MGEEGWENSLRFFECFGAEMVTHWRAQWCTVIAPQLRLDMVDFKKLIVWNRARDVAVEVYRATAEFPAAERFGLTAQIRRSAVSISANIAESCGRPSYREQSRYLSIAQGSARETESHLHIATALGFARADGLAAILSSLDQVERMLSSLIRHKNKQGQLQ